MSLGQILFGFDGRLGRRAWWLWIVVTTVTYMCVDILVSAIAFGEWTMRSEYASQASLLRLIVGLAVQIPFLWVQLALGTKRAHDHDDTAVPVMVLVVVTTAAAYVPAFGLERGPVLDNSRTISSIFIIVTLGSILANLFMLVALGILDGTKGRNRFGPSPKTGLGSEVIEVFD